MKWLCKILGGHHYRQKGSFELGPLPDGMKYEGDMPYGGRQVLKECIRCGDELMSTHPAIKTSGSTYESEVMW